MDHGHCAIPTCSCTMPNLACARPTLGCTMPNLGCARPTLDCAQVGQAQPKFGMVQLKVGIAQWHGLCHLRLVLVDQNLPRIYTYINHFLYYYSLLSLTKAITTVGHFRLVLK